MPRKLFSPGAALLSALLATALLVETAAAQGFAPVSNHPAEVGDLLRRGRLLELDGRWGEALSHYEHAVRQFPDELSLQRRFQFSRLHYDLVRRYSDQSYRELLGHLSLSQSLDLYEEVMVKVQAHYVEAPRWKELVEQGINGFEVALSEQAFLDAHCPNVEPGAVDEFRGQLRRTMGPLVIQSRANAKEAVLAAAGLAQQRLGIEPVALVLEFTCGATHSLDHYSTYLTPDQLADVYSQIEGNFVGLGIELKADDGALLIVRVITGSPAEQAGVLDGDRITAIDGRSTADLSTDEAATLLQGEIDSVVRLTLLTAGQEPRDAVIRRQRVDVPSIDQARILDPQMGVAYLRLTCFQKTTSRDMDQTLLRLHRLGMKSLIIDLRGNPGGLLVSAVEVADKFVQQGVIVSTRGRSVHEALTYSAHEIGTWRVPLVVLIDRDSASAAEIFAGAIRDHGRGRIVGERSYGKGSVQGIFPLSASGAGVRLTTAKFYSPNGRPYSRTGVTPDLVVQVTARPIDGSVEAPQAADAQDPMLSAALQAARQLLARR